MAYNAYCKILKVMPKDATILYLRALCLGELGRGTEAAKEMEGLLKYDPYHRGAIHHLLKVFADDPTKKKLVADLEARLERLRKYPPKVRRVSTR